MNKRIFFMLLMGSVLCYNKVVMATIFITLASVGQDNIVKKIPDAEIPRFKINGIPPANMFTVNPLVCRLITFKYPCPALTFNGDNIVIAFILDNKVVNRLRLQGWVAAEPVSMALAAQQWFKFIKYVGRCNAHGLQDVQLNTGPVRLLVPQGEKRPIGTLVSLEKDALTDSLTKNLAENTIQCADESTMRKCMRKRCRRFLHKNR